MAVCELRDGIGTFRMHAQIRHRCTDSCWRNYIPLPTSAQPQLATRRYIMRSAHPGAQPPGPAWWILGNPSSRAISIRWTSDVPSPTSRTLASR